MNEKACLVVVIISFCLGLTYIALAKPFGSFNLIILETMMGLVLLGSVASIALFFSKKDKIGGITP